MGNKYDWYNAKKIKIKTILKGGANKNKMGIKNEKKSDTDRT